MGVLRGLGPGLALAVGLTGCVERGRPYRFGSPMLARADVPPEPFPDAAPPASSPGTPGRARAPGPIRSISAPVIREASAAAADEVTREAAARGRTFATLPAPHHANAPPAGAIEVPRVRAPDALRALVGQRDKREPIAAALGWARALGAAVPLDQHAAPPSGGAARSGGVAPFDDTAAALLAWAEATHRLGERTDTPAPGDLLVFDRATSDGPADLVAVAIARDARGVVELVYVANGVVRRGFLDATRPTLPRDATRAVVNTFLRHGRRHPPKGTRYLAGELLAHVVRVH